METFLIRALQLIMSLSLLVIVHEGGHFIFARLFKTRVEKFCLFFDPWFTLFKFKPKHSDTEYGIGCHYSGTKEDLHTKLLILKRKGLTLRGFCVNYLFPAAIPLASPCFSHPLCIGTTAEIHYKYDRKIPLP